MASRCRQLSAEERVKIKTLARADHSRKAIAKRLGRVQSTISREMSRNGEGDRPYRAVWAQAFAAGCRQAASEHPRKLQPEDWERIKARLEDGWSLEQIAGREQVEGRTGVSATSLYAWIREQRERRDAVSVPAAAGQGAQGEEGRRRGRCRADSGARGRQLATEACGREVADRVPRGGPDHRQGASRGGADDGGSEEQVRVAGGFDGQGGGGDDAGVCMIPFNILWSERPDSCLGVAK